MVRAIKLHSFLQSLNHRASVVDNSGHVNNLSSMSRGNRKLDSHPANSSNDCKSETKGFYPPVKTNQEPVHTW